MTASGRRRWRRTSPRASAQSAPSAGGACSIPTPSAAGKRRRPPAPPGTLSVFQILGPAGQQTALAGRCCAAASPSTVYGIGVFNLAPVERESERINVEQWTFFLQAFSQLYDVVIDMETTSPLKIADARPRRCRGLDVSSERALFESDAAATWKRCKIKKSACKNLFCAQPGRHCRSSLSEEAAINEALGTLRQEIGSRSCRWNRNSCAC